MAILVKINTTESYVKNEIPLIIISIFAYPITCRDQQERNHYDWKYWNF